MNILYFGNQHINDILHFLTNITGLYDSTTVQYFDNKNYDAYDTVSRCIKIQDDIDLNEILSNARKLRKSENPVDRHDVGETFTFRDSKISKKKSPKRSARKSPRKSPKRYPRKSPRKSPKRYPRKSPRKSQKRYPRKSPIKSAKKSKRKFPRTTR
jgi:hypothetical protein